MPFYFLELLSILAVLAVTANAYSGTFPTECPANDLSNRVVHIPHEYDCAKFYKCVNGAKQLQTCRDYSGNRKLYFNPEKQVCDWPWNVTCTLREPDCPEGSDKEIMLSHPYDCSLYYRCNNGKIVMKCPEGQYFDSVRMMCVNKEEATCYLYWDTCPPSDFNIVVHFPHESNCNEYYECEYEEMILKQCPAGEMFDVNLRKCVFDEEAKCDSALNPVKPVVCPPVGSENLPHETNCGWYYECNDGVKTKKECPGDLSFSPVKGICSWPPSSMCSNNVECPPEGSTEAKRLPHECECSKYYECYKGSKVIQSCPNGTEFDYIREVCDDPDKVNCINNAAVAAVKILCPEKFIRHESDCHYFYECTNGKLRLVKCLEGYYFNDQLKACDFDHGSDCGGTLPMTTTPRNIVPDECPQCDCGINRFPHKLNCSLYYQCENGTKSVMECPDGLEFNAETEICDWPDNVNCSVPTCEEGSNSTHECQCDKYYTCENNHWVLQTCKNGWKFDYIDKVCKPADEARCEYDPPKGCNGECPANGDVIIPHENCTQYCECKDGKATIVDCIKDMFYNPEKQICDWPENIRNLTCDPFPCSNDTDITIPHECNCDRYYICSNGQQIRQFCPDGMEYNYEKLVCEKYEDSHCYKEPKGDTVIESLNCLGQCPKLEPSDRSFTLAHRNCTKFCRCGAGAPYVVNCPPHLHFSEEEQICTEPVRAKCNRYLEYGYDDRDSTMSTGDSSLLEHILPEFF